ncbi:hypothetical protein [Prevotella sp. oral taxon 376]|uniref:hypothetical protein n=1 Tax=Prevotella sp. oral taxon 376 TaxID=712466 RepID=UPI001E440CF2|nr:hypothetical protein [Prevotella sp. oral taxon 376]
MNMPVNLLQRHRFDKHAIEMIALAAIVKALHENSTLYLNNLSIKAFGELFCVSYYKAKSLLEMAKESELFIYNEKKNCLFAKPFKSKFIITRGKRGQYKSAEDYVRKIDVVSEDSVFVNNREKITKVSLRKVITLLRRTLLHNVFSAEKRNELVQENKFSCNRSKAPKSMRCLAKSFGMSKASASRYIKGMVDDKEVSKSEMVAECVIPVLNDTTASEYTNKPYHRHFVAWYNPKSGCWSGWVNLGCKYTIIDNKVSRSFQHVIYNHKKRLSHKVEKPNPLAYLDNFNA